MTEQSLICDRCGYESPVESLSTPDGETMTVDEYVALVRMVGGELLCGSCSGSEPNVADSVRTGGGG
jgi:hypothetical protein